jgi:hypothetical protein
MSNPDWQITACTIICDMVADDVTLLVRNDGTYNCTGHQRYGGDTAQSLQNIHDHHRETGRTVSCAGESCKIMIDYVNHIFTGENIS